MLTKNAVSPSVGLASVITSLTVFVAAYLILAVVDVALMVRYGRKELEPERAPADGADALVTAVRY
jgi:cytochrome bd-type quinol oxidase subunit 1